MKLIKDLIDKKMELHQEFMINRHYPRGIWQFYQCFNLALALIGKEDYDKKRDLLWRKILLSNVMNEKRFKKIQEYLQKDLRVIIQAFYHLDQKKEGGFEMGDIYKPKMIGVLSYEFQA